MHQLCEEAVSNIRDLVEPQGVKIVFDSLPGRAVVGVAREGDLLWLILDLDKPDAREQLAELIATWPLAPTLQAVPTPMDRLAAH